MKSGVLVLLCFVAVTASAGAQSESSATALIESSGLRGWFADQTHAPCVRNQAGILTVGECAGWLRTDRTIFGDYTITFEARAGSPATQGFLGVLGVDGQHRRTEIVMAVPIVGAAGAPRRSAIAVEPVPLSAAARTQAIKADGEWNAYTVTRNRTGVHVFVNGVQVASMGPIRASDGWIGFRVDTGEVDVRSLRLRTVFPTQTRAAQAKAGELVDGAFRPGNGVTLPKLLRDVKPQYTIDAMNHRIEGTVLLECLVTADGEIARATVIRSLDPQYGLDAKAIEAARRWRFEPGSRGGTAVPVWITIEMTFRLEK